MTYDTDFLEAALEPPRAWHVRATAADWTELARWVDWVHDTYAPKSNLWLPPCWPAHSGVAEELAGVHAAWLQAVRQDQLERATGHPSDILAHWHDRWLWPTWTRLRAYQTIEACGPDRGHRPPRRAPPTDLRYFPNAGVR